MKYDVVIAYRIYPGTSKVPVVDQKQKITAVYANNKLALSELCLKSFIASLEDVNYKFKVIIDGCPPEFRKLFEKYVPADRLEIYENTENQGNYATFQKQIELLLAQNESDLVYFAEDDYTYLPGQFKELLAFMKANPDVDFVSPYDHTDYYSTKFHQEDPVKMRVFQNHHFRTGATTTLTFLTRKPVLEKTKSIFLTYGKRFLSRGKASLDVSIWLSLTRYKVSNIPKMFFSLFTEKWIFGVLWRSWVFGWQNILFGRSYSLWIPLPSIATHMEYNALAPTIDWQTYFNKLSE